MAGTVKANAVQLGDSATATQNFVWQTNVDGTAKLARGNLGATTQDVLKISATGVLSVGDNLVFTRGNALGSVSQSIGAPTGALVERGSNGNGEYVRFADGTQICWARYSSVTIVPGATYWFWTYPAAFSAQPFSTANLIGSSSADWKIELEGNTSTDMFGFLFNNAAGNKAVAHTYYAVGRWF